MLAIDYVALFIFALCFAVFIGFTVIDYFKRWKQYKRDELRRQQFIDNVSVISAYCFYKGIASGFEMGRSINDIVQERLENAEKYK